MPNCAWKISCYAKQMFPLRCGQCGWGERGGEREKKRKKKKKGGGAEVRGTPVRIDYRLTCARISSFCQGSGAALGLTTNLLISGRSSAQLESWVTGHPVQTLRTRTRTAAWQ